VEFKTSEMPCDIMIEVTGNVSMPQIIPVIEETSHGNIPI
jgi:hypothetical protein